MIDKILQWRKYFFSFSILTITISIIFIWFNGLFLGMDFVGGTKLEYSVNKIDKRASEEIKESLKSSTVVFTSDSIIIKVPKDRFEDSNIKSKIEATLSKYSSDIKLISFDKISPKFGSELLHNASISIFLSFVVILFYIIYRYEIIFSFSAILTLIHDVIFTLFFLSFFKIEINTSTIAAILTIIGYSLNDTIILFDRIRSSLISSKISNIVEIINSGIRKNFTRMSLTSLTTLFTVSSLLIFGGQDLFTFSFTLFLGIIIGTYSSIFISSTLLEVLNFNIVKYRKNIEEKNKRIKEKEKLRQQFEEHNTAF